MRLVEFDGRSHLEERLDRDTSVPVGGHCGQETGLRKERTEQLHTVLLRAMREGLAEHSASLLVRAQSEGVRDSKSAEAPTMILGAELQHMLHHVVPVDVRREALH